MKIILLRHEERENNREFYTDLTENGVNNSYLLINKLKKFNIDVIFSSPYIRTLQTIYPYCIKYNKKVNIEYGLYEYLYLYVPYYLLGNWYYTINDINNKSLLSIINNNYLSIVNKYDFLILENEISLEKRITKFIDYLRHNYYDKTVLIVSHTRVINKIKDLYVKKTDINTEFKMGHYEVYDI